MSFFLSHLFLTFIFLRKLLLFFWGRYFEFMRIYDILFHDNIKIKLSWLLSEKVKFMTWRVITISINLHLYDSTLYNFIHQYFTIIGRALITFKEQLILFEQIISFDSISWEEYLTSRRNNIIRWAIWTILIEELNFKLNVFIGTWVSCDLFDFS